MAARRAGKKKLTKKQRAAISRRNLGVHKKRKGSGRRRTKSVRNRVRVSRRRGKVVVTVPRRRKRRTRVSVKRGRRTVATVAAEAPRRRRRRSRRRSMAMAAEAPRRRRRRSRRRSYAMAAEAPRRRRRHARRRSYSRSYARSGAMENPLGAMELIVGGLAGLLGYGAADVTDRLIASHALTTAPGATPDANGYTQFLDTPPTTGSAAGLYNASAILAPMSLTRWAAGLGMAAVPLIGAHFVKASAGRAALQFFGFGAGIRTLGKGMSDLVAMLMKKTASGQRLYDAELRAQMAAAGASGAAGFPTAAAAFPTSGLGNTRNGHGFGCGCMDCNGSTSGYTPPLPQPVPPTPVPVPTPGGLPTNNGVAGAGIAGMPNRQGPPARIISIPRARRS